MNHKTLNKGMTDDDGSQWKPVPGIPYLFYAPYVPEKKAHKIAWKVSMMLLVLGCGWLIYRIA